MWLFHCLDEVIEEVIPPTKNSTDEVIHVHKDIGLGGNVVTKLIFFALLMGLGVMIGFIFTEYRGTSDSRFLKSFFLFLQMLTILNENLLIMMFLGDVKSSLDSPWSVMLEGWVEPISDSHGKFLVRIKFITSFLEIYYNKIRWTFSDFNIAVYLWPISYLREHFYYLKKNKVLLWRFKYSMFGFLKNLIGKLDLKSTLTLSLREPYKAIK